MPVSRCFLMHVSGRRESALRIFDCLDWEIDGVISMTLDNNPFAISLDAPTGCVGGRERERDLATLNQHFPASAHGLKRSKGEQRAGKGLELDLTHHGPALKCGGSHLWWSTYLDMAESKL